MKHWWEYLKKIYMFCNTLEEYKEKGTGQDELGTGWIDFGTCSFYKEHVPSFTSFRFES